MHDRTTVAQRVRDLLDIGPFLSLQEKALALAILSLMIFGC